MIDAFQLLAEHTFLQRALLGGLLVAVLSAALGVFVVLRGLSMLGDGLAHVSFGGVALGLALGLYPLPLALLFSVGGALLVQLLREKANVRGDTAIGILFTGGLAFGILVVSATQGFNVNAHAYLFGNILALDDTDLVVVSVVGAGLLLVLGVFRRPFFYMTFNDEAARVSGLPVGLLNTLFMATTAAAIVVASRIVGVLLVSALLVVPAATSLQLARSFTRALVLSVVFAVAGVTVGVLAAIEYGTATGATIALVCTALFAVVVVGKRLFVRGAA